MGSICKEVVAGRSEPLQDTYGRFTSVAAAPANAVRRIQSLLDVAYREYISGQRPAPPAAMLSWVRAWSKTGVVMRLLEAGSASGAAALKSAIDKATRRVLAA